MPDQDPSATEVAPTAPFDLTATWASSSFTPLFLFQTTCNVPSFVRARPGSAKFSTVPGSRVHEPGAPACADAHAARPTTAATVTMARLASIGPTVSGCSARYEPRSGAGDQRLHALSRPRRAKLPPRALGGVLVGPEPHQLGAVPEAT